LMGTCRGHSTSACRNLEQPGGRVAERREGPGGLCCHAGGKCLRPCDIPNGRHDNVKDVVLRASFDSLG